MVGTAAYLAPEQVRGDEATPATDVYALGVVLYQFLTGRLPYEGSTRWRSSPCARRTSGRFLPAPTTPRCPRPSAEPSCRRSRGTRRAARERRRTGRRDPAGLQGEDVTVPLAEGATPTSVLGGETATRRLDQTSPTEFRPARSQTRRPTPRGPRPAAPGLRRSRGGPRKRPASRDSCASSWRCRPGPDRGRRRRRGDLQHRQGERCQGDRSGGRHRPQGRRRIQGPGHEERRMTASQGGLPPRIAAE